MIPLKKACSLILVIAMCLSFAACGKSSDGTSHYKLGDTVSTDIFEFTLNAAEFTIALNNVNDDKRYTPKEYSPEDDADNPYVAPVGHTYAAFSYTVKNLNRASSEFHSGSFATVKYDGKKYSDVTEGAYYLYQDNQVMSSSGSLSTEKKGQWYNNPGSNFLLMTDAKEIRRAYIDIDTEIKDLTESVEITFKIPCSDGEKTSFTYLVTEEDRNKNIPEIEMTLDLAIATFESDDARAYLKEHLGDYPVVEGNDISDILKYKRNVTYVEFGKSGKASLSWEGSFWFESDGRIRDDYGYVNKRTWELNGNTLVINGEKNCEMRSLATKTFLLVCDGEPYMLMQ